MARLTDLPSDVIARILTLLSAHPSLSHGSLTHASHAFALAQCSTQLLRIFQNTLLASIDARNYPDEPLSPYFPGAEVRDPYHLASLARLAGPCLRQIMIPEYEVSEEFSQWPLLNALPGCPNLVTLGFHDPQAGGDSLHHLLETVPRLRIVSPNQWTLRHVGASIQALELVNLPPKYTADALALLARSKQLKTFNVTFTQAHDAGFIPLLVRILPTVSLQHVHYSAATAPAPLPQAQQTSTPLSTLRIDAGAVTNAVARAFGGVIGEQTYVTSVYPLATVVRLGGKVGLLRSVGILGPVGNLEEVVVTRAEEALYLAKHAPRLRVVTIARGGDVTGICDSLRGRVLEQVSIPGELLRCGGAGLEGVREVVVRELRTGEDIWGLVAALPGLLRGLRGGRVRVVLVEGCLQVLDGIWQYGRIRGYGVLRALLWEMETLYEEKGVDFCGLREGVARLVEERDGMVVDEM